jgi:hypothetical protein
MTKQRRLGGDGELLDIRRTLTIPHDIDPDGGDHPLPCP